MNRTTLLVTAGIAGALALGTWVLLQLTTDIGVLTWLGIIGGAVGLVVGGVAFMKLPKLRLGMALGGLLGLGAAALISYQTFFAINDADFIEKQAETEKSQDALDAAFGDDF